MLRVYFCNPQTSPLLEEEYQGLLVTEATSATTTAHCFRNQTQLPNTERGLLLFRKVTYMHFFKKTNEGIEK